MDSSPNIAQRIPLSDFTWSEVGSDLTGKTKIPTNIHLDLLAANVIPDPFIGKNESVVQWVHSRDWVYTCEFPAQPVQQNEYVVLSFEGLDTFAVVSLNGHEILRSDNMFVPHRIEIGQYLQTMNSLQITFESAFNKGEAIRKERGELICWNGHYSRVYVRKAQYHYGWDWGPSLVTCGPWKPITLERYICQIKDVRLEVVLSEDMGSAKLAIDSEIDTNATGYVTEASLIDPSGNTLSTERLNGLSGTIDIPNPKLWYPFSHGQQPLYQMQTRIVSNSGDVLASLTKFFGVRRIELIQSPLEEGSTFYFKVNNIPIFMSGSNWIPGDSFLPRMTPERYRRWIDLAVRGNHVMLRVWGGGIYEDNAFYDECDRRGVLVWQDFCFACGQYPSDKDFVASVKAEAVAALKRLRTHPSLAILAGNNEDYQVANEGLHHDMQSPESEWQNSTFGARLTYERVLPDLVKEYAPWITYWPGSPFGGVDNNSDRTIGDIHIWNVSSGMLLPYQRYPDVAGRFVSEFGMLSCPHIETIKATFFGDTKDFHPQSEEFEFHCKASSYEKRMFTCMGENFRLSFELETYVYLTQLLQSEAMGYAFRGWRRKFGTRECGGALVWQTNDSWPVSSWSVIDYYERPKPAYFVIARALSPLAIGIARQSKINPRPNLQHEAFCKAKTKAEAAQVIAHATPHIYPPRESTFSIWISNSTLAVRRMKVRIRFISIRTGEERCEPTMKDIDVKPLGTTEVITGDTPEDEPTVVVATLLDEEEKFISREIDWPQPLKHITFPNRGLQIDARGEELVIKSAKPVKGLVLLNDGVQWSDNCLDITPFEEQRVSARGLKGEVQYIYYGMRDSLFYPL